jgi:hypothetical protein
MTVEPGRQFAGRYRVEDLLAERAGASLWRAVDEVLRRSVAVDVLPSDSPRASAMVQAARRSAVVTDGRFLRVLDAAEENGDVYVVREWAPGESLDLVLADGPLTHRRAAWIVHEVAEAVSVAHSAGIYHLRLTPRNVLVTDTGGVKIIGLATDAALHGVRHADAEAEDVRGLGRLLYASLVARWPGGPECALPAAPFEHGRLLRPGQVRAGVPRQVDEVCDRILGEPPRHQAEPLRHASAVAAELSTTVRLATDAAPHHDPDQTQASGIPVRGGGYEFTSRLPVPDQPTAPTPAPALRAEPVGRRAASVDQPTMPGHRTTRHVGTATAPIASPAYDRGSAVPPTTYSGPPGPAPAPDRRSGRGRPWLWVALAVLVVALAALSFYIGVLSNQGGDDPTAQQPRPTANALQPVGIASATAFDPFGEDGENDEEASLVLDGNPSTQWGTLSYEGNPVFGGLKPGLGLILDLGKTTDVSRVTIGVEGSGTDLEVRAAPPEAAGAPSAPKAYNTTVGSATGASGRTVVEAKKPVSTRYLLVWLTKLPPEPGGTYSGSISEITVEG